MGENSAAMISRSIIAIVIIATVHALPAPNVVRESKPFVAAQRIVTEMLQEGADPTGCAEAANTTRDNVITNIETKQTLLDSLDQGCSCAALGQDEVTRTLMEMNAASAAVTVAETSLYTATHAQVTLSTQTYHLLSGNECGWTMIDAAYTSALTTYSLAVTTLDTARTTYTFSIQMQTEAVAEAARLKLECQCTVQNDHAQEWASANEDNAINQRAWEQAHQMDCVLAEIYYADCVIPPVPSLTQPSLCDDIESISCAAPTSSAAGSAHVVHFTPPAPPATPTYQGAYGSGAGSGAAVVSDTGCHDTPNWHDSDGADYDCDFYGLATNCADYGDDYAGVAGQTANQACCVCGAENEVTIYDTPYAGPALTSDPGAYGSGAVAYGSGAVTPTPTPTPSPSPTPAYGSGSGSGYGR